MKIQIAIFLIMLTQNTIASVTPRVPERKDFSVIQARLDKLVGFEQTKLGPVTYGTKHYPIYALVSKGPQGKRKNVLLSAGVHGDEPAGVFSLLQFLERDVARYTDRFRFFVLPCVNPSGFEADSLENHGGNNINRAFKKETPAQEAKLVMDQLAMWKETFAFTIDMHEIPAYWADEGFTEKDNPKAAYLYETQLEKGKRIGRDMLNGLPKDAEISHWPKIYGDSAVRGLVSYPEGNGNKIYAEQTTLDGFLHGRFSAHTFTSETPTGWPLEKRIRVQLSWLETALKHY